MRKTLIISIILIFGIHVYAQIDPMAPVRRNVDFQSKDGKVISGLYTSPNTLGPHPAVLMIHEWWGLNTDIAILADALSKEGFVVLAVDAFRGSVAATAEEARKQVTSTPQEQIANDLDSALAYLASRAAVDETRIASWGFCFGGTQAMRMAARNDNLAATVIFYGSGPFQNPDQLGMMAENGPVLGIYGEQDSNIPVRQVRRFEEILNNAGIENRIEIYPDVGHAFVKSDTYDQGGAAERAWEQAVNFLKEHL